MDRWTGSVVAIKVVNLELSNEELLSIQKEISVLRQVRSPFVTSYHDSFLHGSQLWIIMEYCEGGSCADLLRTERLTEAHMAVILRDVLQALVYLHAENKIHRDIKAANVLLCKDGSVRLADFGVAGQLHVQCKRDRAFVGTPYWMSPEVIKQSGYNTKADIWSVGILAYELAMGEPPYADLHPMKVLHLIPRNPPPQLPSSYSPAFRDFVAQCLTRDPLRRPSASELLKHKFFKHAGSTSLLAAVLATRSFAKTRPPKKRPADVTTAEAPWWDFGSLRTTPVEAPVSDPLGTTITPRVWRQNSSVPSNDATIVQLPGP